ncbi:unnamed protein product [Rangifer tarandus platyrhynchus]|uniref:Uncharacterized protein n=1 Tax=Rangifer tarandus platyrhynchus TaxID=3082113 RepID=A0ABN8ZNR6_RANTA|nr:unnamed protein product [Rangifer tarandus platyrhynchus]
MCRPKRQRGRLQATDAMGENQDVEALQFPSLGRSHVDAPTPRVPKEPHEHRLSAATSCLSPGAVSSRDHIQGPLSPEPWPRILENERDSGKCTQARLTLKLVASLPCPTLPAVTSPGPCLTGSPCRINGQYWVPQADLRSPWSWAPERSPLHPSSADTEVPDAQCRPRWNTNPQTQAWGRPSSALSASRSLWGLCGAGALLAGSLGPPRPPAGSRPRQPQVLLAGAHVCSLHPYRAELHLELLPEKHPACTQLCSAVSQSPVQDER